MRILFNGEEHQITLKPKGNTILNGYAVSWNGNLLEGVEDITDYDADGVEQIPEEPQFQDDVEPEIELG